MSGHRCEQLYPTPTPTPIKVCVHTHTCVLTHLATAHLHSGLVFTPLLTCSFIQRTHTT